MGAREKILAAIRAESGGRAVDAERVRREAAALLEGIEMARPTLPTANVVDAFATRVVSPKVAATVDRIRDIGEFPAAVKRYLDERNLPYDVALQPTALLSSLQWDGFAVRPAPDRDAIVGIGAALWGIAETGSLVFHSAADTPILANFLPLHHLVVVRADTILPYLEDYAAAASARSNRPPRNVNIITGASGTTDIEGSLVRGAHGPRYLHIVIAG